MKETQNPNENLIFQTLNPTLQILKSTNFNWHKEREVATERERERTHQNHQSLSSETFILDQNVKKVVWGLWFGVYKWEWETSNELIIFSSNKLTWEHENLFVFACPFGCWRGIKIVFLLSSFDMLAVFVQKLTTVTKLTRHRMVRDQKTQLKDLEPIWHMI